MFDGAERQGAAITPLGDERITRAGRLLRRTQMDELPQLLNVVGGDMSLVGPRPEVPKYVDLFRGDFEALLRLRPGVTGPDSLKYQDEEALLAAAADPEREYVERILPDKIPLARDYVERWSLTLDPVVIVKALCEAVGEACRHCRWRGASPSSCRHRRDSPHAGSRCPTTPPSGSASTGSFRPWNSR